MSPLQRHIVSCPLKLLRKKFGGDVLSSDMMQVLAFPCNQFGNQEPGDSQTIKEFAKNKYEHTDVLVGSCM